MAHDVFVSYAHGDKVTADACVARMEQDGIRCWIAPRDVQPGQNYMQAISDAIESAKTMVLIFSGATGSSPHVRREVEVAVSGGLPILPFRIEDVAPDKDLKYALAGTHWLDALSPPMDAQLHRLSGAVGLLTGAGELARETDQSNSGAEVAGASLKNSRVGGRKALLLGGAAIAVLSIGVLGISLLRSNEALVSASPASAPTVIGPTPTDGSGDAGQLEFSGQALVVPGTPAESDFGSTVTFTNGAEVSVGPPSSFEPTSAAAGHTKGNVAVRQTVSLTNSSATEVLKPNWVRVSAIAGDQPCQQLFDTGILNPPDVALGPGKSVQFPVGFSCPKSEDQELVVSVMAGEKFSGSNPDEAGLFVGPLQ